MQQLVAGLLSDTRFHRCSDNDCGVQGADMNMQNHDEFSAMIMAQTLATKGAKNGGWTAVLELLQQAELDPRLLSRGDSVSVDGLVGAPQHNGQTGVVVKWNPSKQRYIVQVQAAEGVDAPKPIALKPANVSDACTGERVPAEVD